LLQGPSLLKISGQTGDYFGLLMAHLHWSFFEMIDEELHSLSRKVEFAEANFPTYSVYLAGLYVSICSEIDVVAKLLCKRINSDTKADNIQAYRQIIPTHYDFLPKLTITILPIPLDLMPWEIWQDMDSRKNPDWWESHQQVKHRRDEYFKEANLGNVLKSAAGLLVLLVYWDYLALARYELIARFHVFQPDRSRTPNGSFILGKFDLPDINLTEGDRVR
jgi:hypothetical protein